MGAAESDLLEKGTGGLKDWWVAKAIGDRETIRRVEMLDTPSGQLPPPGIFRPYFISLTPTSFSTILVACGFNLAWISKPQPKICPN